MGESPGRARTSDSIALCGSGFADAPQILQLGRDVRLRMAGGDTRYGLGPDHSASLARGRCADSRWISSGEGDQHTQRQMEQRRLQGCTDRCR